TITGSLLDGDQTIREIALTAELEHEMVESLAQTPEVEVLGLEPARARALTVSLGEHVERLAAAGRRPVVLCSSRVRRDIRRVGGFFGKRCIEVEAQAAAPRVRVSAMPARAVINAYDTGEDLAQPSRVFEAVLAQAEAFVPAADADWECEWDWEAAPSLPPEAVPAPEPEPEPAMEIALPEPQPAMELEVVAVE